MEQRIRDHMTEKVMAATLHMLPYPHLLTSEIWPDDIYQQILAGNPFATNDGEPWHKPPHPYAARTQFSLVNWTSKSTGTRTPVPPPHDAFWRTITTALLDDNFWPRLLYKKFSAYFDLRFGNLMQGHDRWDTTLFQSYAFLQRHRQGYALGPHTDVPTRIATAIFGFAQDDHFHKLGTDILVPNDPMKRCGGRHHHSFDEFTTVKVAPYAPNSMFIFFKTNAAFHAVRPMHHLDVNNRFGMQIQLYECGSAEKSEDGQTIFK